mgnify:CR=1 FL=1
MSRPTHIEDYLAQLHTGQWFGWSDSKNKVYANLIIHDDSKDKPSEADCTNGLKTLQDTWDTENATYRLNRANSYPELKEQLDMQYKDLLNGTTTWKDAVAKVKSDNPKG